jgi:hypothetical protein
LLGGTLLTNKSLGGEEEAGGVGKFVEFAPETTDDSPPAEDLCRDSRMAPYVVVAVAVVGGSGNGVPEPTRGDSMLMINRQK